MIFDLSFEPAYNRKLAVAASCMLPNPLALSHLKNCSEIKTKESAIQKTLPPLPLTTPPCGDKPPIPPRPPKAQSIVAMLRQQLPLRKIPPRFFLNV